MKDSFHTAGDGVVVADYMAIVRITKPGDRHEGKLATVWEWDRLYVNSGEKTQYELFLNGEHGWGRYDYEEGDFEVIA